MRGTSLNTLIPSRALFAALLALALLHSVMPLAVISAAHSCSMPCCAGAEGGCSTGACSGAPFKNPKQTEEEKLCGVEDAHAAHGARKESHSQRPFKRPTKTVHCDEDEQESSTEPPRKAANTVETRASRSISPLSLATPCPRDCCAGASSSMQSRRGRDAVALSSPHGALPSGFLSLSLYSGNLPLVASAYLKRLRARAPPTIAASHSV